MNDSLAMATVDADGTPRVAPIGSLFLTEEGRGIYFEKLPKGQRGNLDRDGRFSILAGRGGMLFWLKALTRGRFSSLPGLRLVGRAGKRRSCTPEERKLFDSKFGTYRFTRGYGLLWKDMSIVRDLEFERVEPVSVGPMTRELI